MIPATLTTQMTKSIRYVAPNWPLAETDLLGEVYRQLQRDFMVGPVFVLHSPAPQVMAGVWSILRETLLAGDVDRAGKEAVAATISQINACPFCVDAHTTLLHATGNHEVVDALFRTDQLIPDPQLAALVQWTRASRQPSTVSQALPFAKKDAPALLGTMFTFHYINRMANLFLGDAFLPLPAALKGVTRRVVGATVGKSLVRPLLPGRSLSLVPTAPLPDDFAWAHPNQAVAGALAGFVQIIEAAGATTLPAPVRTLAEAYLQRWQGETMDISRRWVEAAVVDLAEAECTAARLVLLTALASYQVDTQTITAFRAYYPTDQQLVEATAWASFLAARRAINWVTSPLVPQFDENQRLPDHKGQPQNLSFHAEYTGN